MRVIEHEARYTAIWPEDSAGETGIVVMRYRENDPVAVEFLFKGRNPGEEDISWTFARQTLQTGLYEESGVADVGIAPLLPPVAITGEKRPAYVRFRFSSPDGLLIFVMQRRDVASFLAKSFMRVPKAREGLLAENLVNSFLMGVFRHYQR